MFDIKKNIRQVFGVYYLLFLIAIIFIFKLVVFDSKSIIINSYNQRISIVDSKIIRGEIKDSEGNVLAETSQNGTVRRYPYNKQFAHVIGYTTFGKAGIESSMNFSLQKLHLEVIQRTMKIFSDQPLKGNNIILTINSDFQKIAYEVLGERKGAVVILEPSTGKILAQVSYPTFDPNNINDDWSKLNSDGATSPLLNRATKGLYPPGSTFKIVTAAAIIENMENWQDFKYNCTGKSIIDDKEIHCYDNKAHQEVDIYKAMAVSCNTYFAQAANIIGAEKLRDTAERFYFNKNFSFSEDYSVSRIFLSDDSSTSELVETSIGQGKTLATPIYMAMIACAVANDGILMKPYLLDYEQYYNANTGNKKLPEMLGIILTVEEASIIKELLIGAINNGTGTDAAVAGIQVAGKTGTAENSGLDHSWFIGFAPADTPQYAIAVVLENAEKGDRAAPIAGQIFKKIFAK